MAVSFLMVAYTYIGYPMILWILGRWFPRVVRRGTARPNVALVIVAYNEELRIGAKIRNCLALDYPKDRLEIVVASDGSTDGTKRIVGEIGDPRVTFLGFPVRRGKAACLNDAVARTTAEIIVFTDARQRLDAAAVCFLVENFSDPEVGAASGELEFEVEGMSNFGGGVDAYWRYEKFIRQSESAWGSVVGVTGAIYALRRECFEPIPDDTILDDVLIPMNVVMGGKRVLFESRAKAFDLPSKSASQEKMRKVRTIAGNYQLLVGHPQFLLPWRNPIFFQLVSHKVLRLLGPAWLAGMLIANIFLSAKSTVYAILLGLQLLAYAIPIASLVWPRARKWRLVRLATAFLLLNWFAVLGAIEFLRNRKIHMWESRSVHSKGVTR